MAYIGGEPGRDCLFCRKAAEPLDAASGVLVRSPHSLLMLNAFPYNAGHVMVAPLRHTADLTTLDADERADLLGLAARALDALGRAYGPQGYNLGINLGEAAGAGITDHLHLHVVPRWVGDTNFMPVTSETKVIPELLETTYARLRSALGETA